MFSRIFRVGHTWNAADKVLYAVVAVTQTTHVRHKRDYGTYFIEGKNFIGYTAFACKCHNLLTGPTQHKARKRRARILHVSEYSRRSDATNEYNCNSTHIDTINFSTGKMHEQQDKSTILLDELLHTETLGACVYRYFT